MQDIRPISDLRNKFTEISRDVHQTGRPIYLTKNGYGNMVVMSKEAYDNYAFEMEIACELRAAEREAATNPLRYTHEEIMAMMKRAVYGETDV